ncbi:hypothetical protein AaE_015910 [Aphanomyces astaci]|uniref:Uncharacterized protein n=1 Tax=Aphanomyces astaci TaxID=112090 RepID=A0A6A4Z5U4_APHAT|nr:hypothetical protein AaE_015910 [Aphanomyces astaci]
MDELGAPPSKTWHGSRGAISSIVRHFRLRLGRRRNVYAVLVNAVDCLRRGIVYAGHGGQNKAIQDGSVGNEIIADCMKRGHGLSESTFAVNHHRATAELCTVGRSAVYSAYRRLNPVVSTIAPIKQGDSNVGSAWAIARKGWTRQLAVRRGIWEWDSNHGPYPPEFDPAQLTTLSVDQIVSWDETHKKVKIGGGGCNSSKQVRFRRNEEGLLDGAGVLRSPKSYLNTKYSTEARFSLGCAVVSNALGDYVGVRCSPFVYTGQWICTVKEYEILQEQEIQRVKRLTGECSVWVTGLRAINSGMLHQY